MRHAVRSRRLSRPTEHREALLANLVRALLLHGRIRTTVAKAKEARLIADRLISLGKDGSVHARRQAYRVLQDRTVVKRLFAEIAPPFLNVQGGYTRVLRLAPRVGDGAPQALLELTHLPVETSRAPAKEKPAKAAPPQPSATPSAAAQEAPKKPKRFFEGLRGLFRPKKGDVGSPRPTT